MVYQFQGSYGYITSWPFVLGNRLRSLHLQIELLLKRIPRWRPLVPKVYGFWRQPLLILLMEEILHHLGCIKACKWDIYHINWLAGFLNHQPSLPPRKKSVHPHRSRSLSPLNMINKSIPPWSNQAADDLSCQKKWHPLLWQCAAHIAWHMGGFWRSGNLKPGRVICVLIRTNLFLAG